MDKHINRLLQLMKTAEAVEKVSSGKLAASVWYSNDLISVGVNQHKTHPIQKKFASNPERIYLHAETDAIARAVKRLNKDEIKKSILYVARVKYDGICKGLLAGMAKSCGGCVSCAAHFGIKKIYYTLDKHPYNGIGEICL